MADKKITELTALTTAGASDLLVIVDNSGTPTTKKITSSNFKTGLAPTESPTFTGTPAAPTAPVSTSTTQIATTAFVMNSKEDDQFILASAIF